MDSPFFTLVVALYFGFFALIVESQGNLSYPPPPPPPPPPSPPPPSPPPPSPPPSPLSDSPPPPPLSESPPPPQSPPPPYPPPRRRPPPRPRRGLRPPPLSVDRGDHSRHRSVSRTAGLNTGKKVGLMFIGVVVILQVCVAAFLFIQRRQIFKDESV